MAPWSLAWGAWTLYAKSLLFGVCTQLFQVMEWHGHIWRLEAHVIDYANTAQVKKQVDGFKRNIIFSAIICQVTALCLSDCHSCCHAGALAIPGGPYFT